MPSPADNPADGPSWPLTGRATELDVITDMLCGDSPGVVLVGDIGVGKSRLTDAVAERLAAEGWSIRHNRATEARMAVPFAALAGLLDLSQGRTDPLQRVFDATEQLAAGEAPVLLVVDDAHWLDAESLAFVHHVIDTTTVRVVFAVRSPHRRADEALAAARTLGLRRVELQPLGRADVSLLLQAVRPGLNAAEARALWDVTQGNPLFLHEIVSRWVEQGQAIAIDGGALADVVGDRLADLDDDQQQVLELVAVGGNVALDLLQQCSSADCVAGLERRGLAVADESGDRLTARLAHPVYGEVLMGRMGLATQRLRRRRLLDDLNGRESHRSSDLVQLAVWGVDQGDAVDPELLVSVAKRLVGAAYDSLDRPDALPPLQGDLPVIAARLAKAAVDHGGGFDAAEVWFGILVHIDSTAAAADEGLAAMTRLAATEEQRVLAATTAATVALLRGSEELSDTIDELADLAARTSGANRRAVQAVLAYVLTIFLRTGEAITLSRSILDDEVTAPRDRLIASMALAGGLGMNGQTLESLAVSERAFLALPADPDGWALGGLVFIRAATLRICGRLDEADMLAEAGFATSEAAGNHMGMGMFGVVVAEILTTRGRLDDAHARARAVSEILAGHQTSANREAAQAHSVAALALAYQGDARGARLEQTLAEAAGIPAYKASANRTTAWVAVAEGRRGAALELLRGYSAQYPEDRFGAMLCLHELVRLGERGGGAAMQAMVDDGVDGELWLAATARAVAFDAGDGAGLDIATEAFAEMGAMLDAAEAAAQAAEAHGAAGDRSAATASRRRCRELAALCQGAATPALREAGDAQQKLTARELEVARLAAAGMTDQAIADEVHLSVRTVETYLYRVYFKLGIEGRAELVSHPEI